MREQVVSKINMVKLRSLASSDILRLDELWQEHWSDTSLPGLRSRIVDALAVDEDDKIIGYGQVKLFAEAMLFLDPTTRKKDRVQALRLLMLEAFRGTEKANIEDIYTFIKDPDFALIIEKHFGFERVLEPRELLLRRVK